jgi:hypothetical protein
MRNKQNRATIYPGRSTTLVKAKSVIPAKAGIDRSTDKAVEKWIPDFAGMTA